MSKKVIVLGGGVAGMSTAHELCERGFEVHVYEAKSVPGGKARSIPIPGTARGGRKDLPGEHGFRFFPGFYRHVTDTMKRIPYGGNTQGVFDNLVDTTRVAMTELGRAPMILLSRFPRNLKELELFLWDALFGAKELGLTQDDIAHFALRLWQFLTSCNARRDNDYEQIGWWDFVDASQRSLAYQRLLAQGMTRSLVAADAKVANTRNEGDVGLQLILDLMQPGISSTDRVLDGPTSEVWLDPWLSYLTERGVQYHEKARFESLSCRDGRIVSARVRVDGEPLDVTGDYYVVAVPLEVFARVLENDVERGQNGEVRSRNVLAGDPALAGVIELAKANTAWMNGIQFYLYRDVPFVHGHVLMVDSAWSLTAISQPQFWKRNIPEEYGDGTVKGILSVDISDWNTKGNFVKKPAKECTKDEIAFECWNEVRRSFLDRNRQALLHDDDVHSWFLDPDIEDLKRFSDPGRPRISLDTPPGVSAGRDYAHPEKYTDAEPLFVATTNTWTLRPEAFTRIPNLFLASDYVRTYTQLATMEAANEAARRAVNGILSSSGSKEPLCRLWPLHEPDVLLPLRLYDRLRYDRGLPWTDEVPALVRAVHAMWSRGNRLLGSADLSQLFARALHIVR